MTATAYELLENQLVGKHIFVYEKFNATGKNIEYYYHLWNKEIDKRIRKHKVEIVAFRIEESPDIPHYRQDKWFIVIKIKDKEYSVRISEYSVLYFA
jgi:hypothetical protein